MKGLISIFALPQEIDNLHTTLYNLKRNSSAISDGCTFGFDITLCLSDVLTDWEKSTLPKKYFEDKFHQIVDTLCSWATPESVKIEYGTDILGCVSHRRHSLKFLDKYDFTLWLDTDVFFNDYLLAYIAASVDIINKQNISHYVLTPQITRQWDTTWDVLVNKHLLSRNLNDNFVADVFKLALTNYGQINLNPIPEFKGAGGWGTVISNSLLKLTGIPESFGHYGLEDTYVLACAHLLRTHNTGIYPQQFVMENVLVCENHKHGTKKYLSDNLVYVSKQDEFRKIATDNFLKEIEKFISRYQNNGHS
jgi:hypothetical protein